MKKAITMMASALVVTVMMTSCTGQQESAPIANSEPASTSTAPAADGRMFEETFHIRWLEEGRPHLYDENNMVEQAINEALNVQIEYIQIPFVQFAEQMGIILASRDLPDVINFMSLTNTADWAEQGAIIPLDALLQSHGQDIMAQWGEDDWLRVRSAKDGEIYGIPAVTDVQGAFSVMYRQDVLAELGLNPPSTLDEYLEVLRAVRDGTDMIPYAGMLRPFENAFGIYSSGTTASSGGFMIIDDEYISMWDHPNYMEYIEFMRMMYSEGLIDPEFFIRNAETTRLEELFFADRAFMAEQWAAFAETSTRALAELNPDAVMMPTDPIIGPYGHQQIMGRSRWMAAGAISSQAQRPEDLMKVLNWFFTDDGIMMTNFGVEGQTFEFVDGEPRLLPEFASFPDSRRVGINKAVAPIVMTTEYFFQAQLQGQDPEDLPWEIRLFYDGMNRNLPFIYLPIHQFITPTFASSWETIRQTLVDADVQSIIGNISIEDHKRIIDQQKANGLDTITREMNEAFDRVR